MEASKEIKGKYDTSKKLKVSDGKDGRFNCTTYVETALKRSGFEITSSMSKQINISEAPSDPAQLAELLEKNDPRLTGVVGALVDSGQGRLIDKLSNCEKGDLLQMWSLRKKTNKETGESQTTATGHTGIIDKVNGRDVVLWGAHKSLGEVGPQTYHLRNWHGWCVRPKK